MPTFQRCDKSVNEMADELLAKFETHALVKDAKVKIDFVFAYPDVDKYGEPKGCALQKNGHRALGITRKISLKDRALGRGDAEIALDGEWWNDASERAKRALLDHELHHIAVKTHSDGAVQRDDLQRPKLDMRKHDIEIGWFHIIAERHGDFSMERCQAKLIVDKYGQYYFPNFPKQVSVPA